jgi:integrase
MLLLTGLRPGELTHLLLPHGLDLEAGWLHVRNKPRLEWLAEQVQLPETGGD